MNSPLGINKDLLATLSHQLKSPVTTIESLLKTVSDGFTGETNAQTLQFIAKAIAKTGEAQALIADLLNYQAYSGAAKIDKEEVDIASLAETAASSFTAEASDKGVSLRIRMPEKTAIIANANSRGLDIAFRNIMENAVKYTPADGHVLVKLTVSEKTKRTVLQVSDSGYGIPGKELGQIFNPFFRSIKHKATVPGTGLGLAIAKTIVAAHAGTVTVSSREGKGSTFKVALPYRILRKKTDTGAGKKKVLIIGGVTAGPKAAARLRRLDEQCDITIIERSEFLSYSGCGLPSYISGRVQSPKALMSTADNTVRDIHFFESIKNIKIFNRTEAVKISRKKKTVTVKDLATRETRDIPYDVLVLATGADSFLPPIPGIRLKGVYSLHRMEDAEAIKNECAAGSARDVYIIGGGLIGIETAESLIEAGARVTILEKESHILSSLFDGEFSGKIQNAFNRKGVKIVTGVSITRITKRDGRLALATDRGRFAADLVILSTGVRPNSALAKKAGLTLSRIGAIQVTSRLMTSDRSIYAIGDCAESVNSITGKHEYWPLGSISTKMGRIAADNIAGRPSEFHGSIGTAMFQNFGLSVARTGLTLAAAVAHGFKAKSVVITGLDRAHYSDNAGYITIMLIADAATKAVLGAQAYGRGDVVRQIQVAASAITNALTLSDVFGLDLGYSPAFNNPIDIVQTASLVLASKMEGFVNTMTLDWFYREKGSLRIIDVSPFSEHVAGAIPGSVNVPLENLRREGIPFDKKDRCVLYSRTSSRAYEAYRYLVTKGYGNLSILEGGFVYWTE
jgi:NADPH-dependent 2,4-dienoyl-CoA reductase/sulfur reductase-like enzyme/rhodanese-related sulfurtransferase/two-component sensor histidine kinase